tara:strand:- start:826 stop:1062 length:237 start_codon:yes stop_codon:yes gene_type:complete
MEITKEQLKNLIIEGMADYSRSARRVGTTMAQPTAPVQINLNAGTAAIDIKFENGEELYLELKIDPSDIEEIKDILGG